MAFVFTTTSLGLSTHRACHDETTGAQSTSHCGLSLFQMLEENRIDRLVVATRIASGDKIQLEISDTTTTTTQTSEAEAVVSQHPSHLEQQISQYHDDGDDDDDREDVDWYFVEDSGNNNNDDEDSSYFGSVFGNIHNVSDPSHAINESQ